MEASPSETISLTEYYPCRTDKAPADSRGAMMAGVQRSEPFDLEACQCSGDAGGHGGTLERMHTVSSTETSGYVDAASSPTAAVSSPAASSSVVPSATGDTMTTEDVGPFYPSSSLLGASADGQLLLPLRSAICSRRPDAVFVCDNKRDGEEHQRPGTLCRPTYQRRDTAGRGGPQQVPERPGTYRLHGQSVAFRDDARRNELPRRNRKEDDDEEEEVEEEEDDEEEETCSSSEEDGDYWQREDSSMFDRRSSKSHHQRSSIVVGAAGHRAAPSSSSDRTATDAAHEQGQGHGGQFLGKATQSAWLKWSHERRASFKRRVEFMEQRQTELQRVRLSSPIRKARKESVRFVAKELEQEHLAVIDPTAAVGPEDETSVYGQHPAFPFDIPPSTKKKKKVHSKKAEASSGGGGGGAETRLSLAQWNTLVAFWEHRLFVKLRCCGLLLGLAALACGVSSLANNQWSTYESQYNASLYGYTRAFADVSRARGGDLGGLGGRSPENLRWGDGPCIGSPNI